MNCPNCSGTEFEDNDGKINYSLVYLCKKCGEQIDVGSCDHCGKIFPIDEIVTEEAPYLCARCVNKK